MRKKITSEKGAPVKGVYSPAILTSSKMLFVSGQGPVDPKSGEFILNDFRSQAKLTFDNLTTMLEAGGATWENVVKVSVFLADLKDFQAMNEVYEKFLTDPYPARTTVAAGLPPNMLIEVDCIAVLPED